MNQQQYILKALKATGQLYVQHNSALHATCRDLAEQHRVELQPERSPVGPIWRVTAAQKGTAK